ncbi:MAG: hypothetical protein C7B43_14360 [Sulfobacillus benefaciens]|uniref:Uncharacterized protein n=1 Tax=Sulfobacillus benefaciens TaxID=453960 RepID=A0A2T2WVF1_9FIRM|nr:MAG: hypothetical protein C7B43_14360 [Sulfobacillus benefaciens]
MAEDQLGLAALAQFRHQTQHGLQAWKRLTSVVGPFIFVPSTPIIGLGSYSKSRLTTRPPIQVTAIPATIKTTQ